MHNVVEFARSRNPDDVPQSLLDDLLLVKRQIGADLHSTHYLVQDVRNAVTFAASALDDARTATESCFEEWLLWEALFPTLALPMKKDKLRNIVLASSSAAGEQQLTGTSNAYLLTWLALYDPDADEV